ncbi:MAG: hypothetical protein H0T82_04425 [Sphingomonas sp.]|nr:hypothetical protein [Sphingomonas sp.]
MANYKEQIRDIWKRYRDQVSTDPVDLKEVAAWALSHQLWAPRPIDLSASLAKDLADSLREEKRIDKAGREYRANIPVRQKGDNGVPLFVWADIDDAPRTHVEKSIQQERRSIQSDCYALAMKAEHYNEAHPVEEPIQIILNFEDDVEEMKIANGLFDEGEEAA